ncbi:MAG: 1,4-alpha-glucan branching protein GlgB [Synergistaceae bacterium]|nr:1,4-alpha-glucan branching protein GlgB [Synergistaceae bacterium]
MKKEVSSGFRPGSALSEQDLYLFREGTHRRLYEKMGAHLAVRDGKVGVHFAIWAPNAEGVSVIGDFNGWDPGKNPLQMAWPDSGIWEGFVAGARQGDRYKYHLWGKQGIQIPDKLDPFGFYSETPPKTASIVWDLSKEWQDGDWMENRKEAGRLTGPMSVYEVHLGSWRRSPGSGDFLTYREMAPRLAEYVREMGFTHVEFLPVMEHPFYGSWGYQTLGYFAPTSRYGSPQDFMFLVETLHRAGIGVILDWVPSHFPTDPHGLAQFDGTHLYEHRDPRQGFHPDWKSAIFNYGRNEVRSFLLSSAAFWLDRYHADGLRVDAVASMLYLDYSRKAGEWVPNRFGGRENLEAVDFLRMLNTACYGDFEGIQTIAEESTAWPMVTRPAHLGGLGFGLKWNMGWMHDILEYFGKDPVYRKHCHDRLTFSIWYAFSENFLLPLSHDEVVYGKGSLYGKMPGDPWKKFANLRLLLGFQAAHPGKKLLFMGGEFGQEREWNHEGELDWQLLKNDGNAGAARWVKDLNRMLKETPALYEGDFDPSGFEWVDFRDVEKSVVAFLRKRPGERPDPVLVVCNFTPVPRHNYRVGVPVPGFWSERLNSDAKEYGGSGQGNMGGVESVPVPFQGFDQSVSITLPPLGILFLVPSEEPKETSPQ